MESVISARIGGGLLQAVLSLLSSPYEIFARKIYEACNTSNPISCEEDPIWRILGGSTWKYLRLLISVLGHNVRDVDQIALTYERMFQADMRTVSLCLYLPLFIISLADQKENWREISGSYCFIFELLSTSYGRR